MVPMKLFGSTINVLEATLDRRVDSHRFISRNIANADTPNYRGHNLEFQRQLRNALDGGVVPASMAKTHPGHMPYAEPRPLDHAEPESVDTGPVHLDIEMSRLAENNLMFNAMVQLLQRKYSGLKSAIAEKAGG
jgi:flagellar basal-body rod protein FlgB